MVTLPDADWRAWGAPVVAALGGGDQARFVGGAVRDELLGIPVADVDIATRLPPGDVVDLLRRAGIKAVPTGIAHGTITAVVDGRPIEVTTLRRDVSTNGRHAVVAFTDDWREDAARRDFTMNALYADPATGEVVDYFGGLRDLATRTVRFIGDPSQRIAEDHLRILRFFRFMARFGDAPDAARLAACAARANDLMALSRERIRDELLKLLVAKDAVRVVGLMLDHGIFAPVLPEIDRDGLARLSTLVHAEAAQDVAPDTIRRLAVLIVPDAAATIGARLKLSKRDRKRLEAAVSGVGNEGPSALAYRVGLESARDRLLIAGQDTRFLDTWVAPVLPVSGGMLVERGLIRGPDVARTLHVIEDRWIAADFPGDATALIDDALAQALAASSNA